MRQARVIRSYKRAYENPIRLKRGDKVELGRRDDEYPGWRWCTNEQGIGGWVPELILDDAGIATRDYDAIELTVAAGDILTVETQMNGWLWCVAQSGEKGWVPESHMETLESENNKK